MSGDGWLSRMIRQTRTFTPMPRTAVYRLRRSNGAFHSRGSNGLKALKYTKGRWFLNTLMRSWKAKLEERNFASKTRGKSSTPDRPIGHVLPSAFTNPTMVALRKKKIWQLRTQYTWVTDGTTFVKGKDFVRMHKLRINVVPLKVRTVRGRIKDPPMSCWLSRCRNSTPRSADLPSDARTSD